MTPACSLPIRAQPAELGDQGRAQERVDRVIHRVLDARAEHDGVTHARGQMVEDMPISRRGVGCRG